MRLAPSSSVTACDLNITTCEHMSHMLQYTAVHRCLSPPQFSNKCVWSQASLNYLVGVPTISYHLMFFLSEGFSLSVKSHIALPSPVCYLLEQVSCANAVSCGRPCSGPGCDCGQVLLRCALSAVWVTGAPAHCRLHTHTHTYVYRHSQWTANTMKTCQSSGGSGGQIITW